MNYPALFLRMMAAILALYLLVTSAACKKKDPCKNTTCLNGGVCIDGTCKCPEGYYGEGCELYKSSFPGNWTGSHCYMEPLKLIIRETDTAGIFALTLNYAYTWHLLKGTAKGKDTMMIEPQLLRISGNMPPCYISGWLASKGETIVYDNQFKWGSHMWGYSTDTCTGVYMRD